MKKPDKRIGVLGIGGRQMWPCLLLNKGLAICKPEGKKGWYSVTHVQSGCCVVSTRLLKTAKLCVADLLQVKESWDVPATELFSTTMDGITEIFERYHGK